MNDPVIAMRAELAGVGLGTWRALDTDECEREFAIARRAVTGRSHRLTIVRSLADDDLEEMRAWLRSLPVPADEPVIVLWPDMRSGIFTTFGGFVNAFDDLWFPSSDDVWIMSARSRLLMELDHEEVFRCFEPGPGGRSPDEGDQV